VPGAKVRFVIAGVTPPAGTEVTATDSGTARLTIDAVVQGTYTVHAYLNDNTEVADSPKTVRFVPTTVPGPAPGDPIVDPSDGTKVTGKGDPGSVIVIVDDQGTEIGRTVVDQDGNWTATLNPPAQEGDIITAVSQNADGTRSGPINIRVGLPRLVIKTADIYIADLQTITAYNLQPFEVAGLIVHSDPLDLGTARADANGTVTFRWYIDATSTPAGQHQATITGPKSGAVSGKFNVLDVAARPLVAPTITPAPLNATEPSVLPAPTPTPSPAAPAAFAPLGRTEQASLPRPARTPTTTATASTTPQPITGIVTVPATVAYHPKTGGEGLVPVLGVALGTLLTGLFLLAAQRRRKEAESS
jgi:hypothetical protein